MKYTDINPPLVCMMENSTCYRRTRKMEIKGVLWHDTGCNNPNLKRYVQPGDDDPNKEALLEIIGKNKYRNDHNHKEGTTGMNYWIGKLANGSVAAVQVMPDDYRPWGCGSGKNGSCNNGWIQFEICEDGKNDRQYLEAAYQEACELTAYLCKKYGIDPNGTADNAGKQVPTVLCHADSHRLGFGSNHADVNDWFPKFGKSMETARNDISALLQQDQPAQPEDQLSAAQEPQAQPQAVTYSDRDFLVWSALYSAIGNPYGVAGLMGNLKAESALNPKNLQNNGNRALGMTDDQFTEAFDNGQYSVDTFIHDGYGYGIAQWTYWSRKQALAEYAASVGASIGSLEMQLGFLVQEIKKYSAVWKVLVNATSVKEASDAVLTKYEKPANQSEENKERRASLGQPFYDQFAPQREQPVYTAVIEGLDQAALDHLLSLYPHAIVTVG